MANKREQSNLRKYLVIILEINQIFILIFQEIYQDEISCDIYDLNDIEMIGDELRLFPRRKNYLSHKFTGVTLVSKWKFQNVRIEILVKRPLDKEITAAISLILTDQENQHGNILGQVDIARFHKNKLTEFGLKYGQDHYHNYSFLDKYRDQNGLQLY